VLAFPAWFLFPHEKKKPEFFPAEKMCRLRTIPEFSLKIRNRPKIHAGIGKYCRLYTRIPGNYPVSG